MYESIFDPTVDCDIRDKFKTKKETAFHLSRVLLYGCENISLKKTKKKNEMGQKTYMNDRLVPPSVHENLWSSYFTPRNDKFHRGFKFES